MRLRISDIEECWLQEEPSNAIRNRVRELALERDLSFHDPRSHEGLLRGLIVRSSLTGLGPTPGRSIPTSTGIRSGAYTPTMWTDGYAARTRFASRVNRGRPSTAA